MNHQKRPNIVLFAAEDLDWEGVNCYDPAKTGLTGMKAAGNAAAADRYEVTKALTPTLDGLARDGAMFTNYYCTSAICTPARYTMLTGRYAERSAELLDAHPAGSQANIWFNTDITRTETTLPKALKAAGYTTCITGKWHNFPVDLELPMRELTDNNAPDADPRDPEIRSRIEKAYAMGLEFLKEGFGWDRVDRLMTNNCEPVRPFPLNANNTEWIIEGALGFLEDRRDADDPFFLYVAINAPHSRYDKRRLEEDPRGTRAGLLDEPPEGMPSRESAQQRAAAAGLNENVAEGVWIDDAVNAVQKKLREIGAEEETLFIFTTDHPTVGKGSTHLGRIPLIVSWPGRLPEHTVHDRIVSQTDLAPTILDLAGCEIPEDMRTDGESFAPLLRGADAQNDGAQGDGERDTAGSYAREHVMLELVNSRALVHGKWKYIANRLPDDAPETVEAMRQRGWHALKKWTAYDYGSTPVPWGLDEYFPHYFDEDQLYDIEADPLEQHSLAGDPAYASVVAEMKERLAGELRTLPHRFGELA
jgi:arylsulfatase A-like enzyme